MKKKKILFVCIENSNRSQMSQAFAKMIGGENVAAYSAGSKPSGVVNPKAIAAMKETGYDLSTHGKSGRSKGICTLRCSGNNGLRRCLPVDACQTIHRLADT